jgi:prepilin-type N-terminal cleavage/methylation domain-containing protein
VLVTRRGGDEAGFTMIELMVAMAVFSFMLLIIVVGFINVVRIHNQALASNIAQDNARGAMDELVRAVRDSTGVVTPLPGASSNTLCLADASGPPKVYYVSPLPPAANAMLYRATDCAAHVGATPVLSQSVKVVGFTATVETSGSAIVKPHVELNITVASSNGTASPTGVCGPTNADRQFCSSITLTSGAVPR